VQAQEQYPSIRPLLGLALVATLAVVALPVVIVFGVLALLDPDPHMFVNALVGLCLSVLVTTTGSKLWSRRPRSAALGFSDLMLWQWMRRRRAERTLEEGARLLGLDRSGQPAGEIRIAPDEQLRVLKDLTAALESKDPYTLGHSRRVERYCYQTAAVLGLQENDIEDVRKAAALHDVGKICVPDRILRKEGPLSFEEQEMIRAHAVVGAWMVASVGNADVISAVRHHHEHWNGAGYPDGLSATEIPLFARVIAVADAYDAITSTRPYRAESGRDEAVAELRAKAHTQFDPDVVEAFVAALPTRLAVTAWLLVFLADPAKLFREIVAWFRRFGAGSMTPAVGAAGAAVMITTSAFVPQHAPNLAPPRVHSTATQVSAISIDQSARDSDPGRKIVRRERARHRVVAAQAPADDVAAAEEVAGATVDSVDLEQSAPSGSHTPPPDGAGSEGGPDQEPAPEPSVDESKDPPVQSKGDPQPDKGQDCSGHAEGHSKGDGIPRHCG
jgi:putative nucleotidyltransferase with HDIG domain